MPSRKTRSRPGSEAGAVAAEYAPLIVVIAVLVIMAVGFLGPWISAQLSHASEPLAPNAVSTLVGVSVTGAT
jgi:Flp pilus assembly pilin Flp